MKFDSEEQRAIMLHLINEARFPGSVIEKIIELKTAINSAEIEELKENQCLIKEK